MEVEQNDVSNDRKHAVPKHFQVIMLNDYHQQKLWCIYSNIPNSYCVPIVSGYMYIWRKKMVQC